MKKLPFIEYVWLCVLLPAVIIISFHLKPPMDTIQGTLGLGLLMFKLLRAMEK